MSESMEPMTDERLDEIKEITNMATAGPWLLERPTETVCGFRSGMMVAAVARNQVVWCDPPGGIAPEDNRKFIAASREFAVELLNEVERLKNALNAWEVRDRGDCV